MQRKMTRLTRGGRCGRPGKPAARSTGRKFRHALPWPARRDSANTTAAADPKLKPLRDKKALRCEVRRSAAEQRMALSRSEGLITGDRFVQVQQGPSHCRPGGQVRRIQIREPRRAIPLIGSTWAAACAMRRHNAHGCSASNSARTDRVPTSSGARETPCGTRTRGAGQTSSPTRDA